MLPVGDVNSALALMRVHRVATTGHCSHWGPNAEEYLGV